MVAGVQPKRFEMIPKTIWSVWFQGWERAPPLVRACRASWERLNSGWEHRFLTDESVLPDGRSVADLFPQIISPAARSDAVRLELLGQHGGVWVDATTYCLRPLDLWLPGGAFFAFERPGPGRLLSTWCLATEPGGTIIEAWRDAMRQHVAGRTSFVDYFWVHHLFGDLCRRDPRVKSAWDAAPKVSADGPHCFVPYEKHLRGPVDDWTRSVVEQPRRGLLKLTRHVDETGPETNSVARWLCEREGIDA